MCYDPLSFSRMGDETVGSAFAKFSLAALTWVPATTIGLLTAACTIRYFGFCYDMPRGLWPWLDSPIFAFSLMTLSRAAFYEVLTNNGVDPPSAQVAAFFISSVLSVVVLVVIWCTKKVALVGAVVFCAFLAFILIYGVNPWPMWLTVVMIGVVLLLTAIREYLPLVVKVCMGSFWYAGHIVYGVSYFWPPQDLSAYHDVVHDVQLAFACWTYMPCAVRVSVWVVSSVARVIGHIYAWQRNVETKETEELDKLKDQLDQLGHTTADAHSDPPSSSSSSSDSSSTDTEEA
jgi:hypothetical protein